MISENYLFIGCITNIFAEEHLWKRQKRQRFSGQKWDSQMVILSLSAKSLLIFEVKFM